MTQDVPTFLSELDCFPLSDPQPAWVSPDPRWDQGAEGPAWRLFTQVTLEDEVAQATAFFTAKGVADLWINGQLAHAETMLPGFASYRHRMPFVALDVTGLLRAGANRIGAEVADGWWRGRIGFDGGWVNLWGSEVAVALRIDVTYRDGRTQTIVTDQSWHACPSPRLRAGLYGGETYDARLDSPAWMTPGAQVTGQREVATAQVTEHFVPLGQRRLVPCERLRPATTTRLEDGTILVDFGQNASGRVRVTADIPAGRALRLRHAEVCQEGRIYTRPLRLAHAEDVFLGDGQGLRTFEARFTTHGFRYVELSDATEGVDLDSLEFVVVRSPIALESSLETSSDLLNQLVSNVQWSLRSNFASIPTDCPQRDERMGWTGDIQAFGPTALTLGDCAPFLVDWLRDVRAEQVEHGSVPVYVPFVPAPHFWNATPHLAVWDDVATLLPWALWERTGDRDALAEEWPLTSTWADQLIALLGEDDLWRGDLQLADWLDPTAPPDNPLQAQTDPDLVANAFAYRSLDVAAQIGRLLDRPDEAQRYEDAAARVRAAWRARYLEGDSALTSPTQTAYALAIVYGLLDDDELPAAGERLSALVAERDGCIATGFAGTPVICDALTQTGHVADAYRMLGQTRCPSWCYPITQGATTVWERWDSLLPDGTVNPGGMTSFNHYALGAVVDWMFRVIGGISPATPGYAQVTIAPQPGGDLTSSRCRLATVHGTIASDWTLEDGTLTVTGALPEGVTGTVILPGGSRTTIAAGPFRVTE